MPRARSPRKGSKSFSPRRRASNFNGRIHYWPDTVEGPQILGFAGYKAGMTHLFQIEDREKVPEAGQEVKVAATVIDAPPMLLCAIRGYVKTSNGLKSCTETWMNNPTNDIKKLIKTNRKENSNTEYFLSQKDKMTEVRVLAATQPRLTALEKNIPDIIEIKIGGGNIEQQLEYAINLLGKTVRANDIFKSGENIDLAGVTKGKGFQGPVKRYGVRILQNKSRKTIRGVAAINPASPRTIHPHVARAGQMGAHHRFTLNKRILMLGNDGDRVTPSGGFNNYGMVKGDYILIKGSIQGTSKRLIRIRKAIRETKYPTTPPEIIYINTEWGKEKSNQ
nr:50S ribosomal protein L3P [uncultured archaeon]